jgi:hypothetical protein
MTRLVHVQGDRRSASQMVEVGSASGQVLRLRRALEEGILNEPLQTADDWQSVDVFLKRGHFPYDLGSNILGCWMAGQRSR